MPTTPSRLHDISRASREREAQAVRELGSTTVSTPVAATLVGVVLGLALTVPILDLAQRAPVRQAWSEFFAQTLASWEQARAGDWWPANETLRRAMASLDRRLEDDTWVQAELLPPVREGIAALGGRPSPDVLPGVPREDRWLFYRPAVDHLIGPPFLDPRWLAAQRRGIDKRPPQPQDAPDPRPAIAGFAASLAARGIELVLVPVPVKGAIEGDRLTGRPGGGVLANPSLTELAEFARSNEIGWIDLAPDFAVARRGGASLYLERDTHWRPEAVEIAAERIAAWIREHHPEIAAEGGWQEEERSVEGFGDLVTLARLPAGQTVFPRQTITTRFTFGPDGQPWRPDSTADVLVLGDSFVNVFSQPELGWGEGAGFAERLSFHLGLSVDRVARNAGGPAASREALERLTRAGEDRLAGKGVVVWVFSARELSVGDWQTTD